MTDWKPTEILPATPGLLDQLRRTRATWRLDVRTPLADIARETLQQRNACAIVNLRDQASALVSLLHEERGSDEGAVLPDHGLMPGPPDPGGGNALH